MIKKGKSLSFLFFPQELLQQFVVLSKGSIPSQQAWVRLGQSIIDPIEWVTLNLLSGADWKVIFVIRVQQILLFDVVACS